MKKDVTRGAILFWFALGLFGLAACAVPPPQAAPIEYRRTGGIVGFNDHLTVAASGKATLTRRAGKSEFTLTSAELARLHDALQNAQFATLPADTRPSPLIPDSLSYEIAYQGRRVRTADGGVPKSLEPVLALLNGVIEAQGK